jgi:hypothetical protein
MRVAVTQLKKGKNVEIPIEWDSHIGKKVNDNDAMLTDSLACYSLNYMADMLHALSLDLLHTSPVYAAKAGFQKISEQIKDLLLLNGAFQQNPNRLADYVHKNRNPKVTADVVMKQFIDTTCAAAKSTFVAVNSPQLLSGALFLLGALQQLLVTCEDEGVFTMSLCYKTEAAIDELLKQLIADEKERVNLNDIKQSAWQTSSDLRKL